MIPRLQYITQDLKNKSHQELAQQACLSGIKWLQLRVKNKADDEWLKIGMDVQMICKKHQVTFILNDRVDIAKSIKADGVHLGKSDMDLTKARKILGTHAIIGATANTFEDIQILAKKGADYIGLGPFRFTETKKNLSPTLGLDGYKKVLLQCLEHNISIPIVAIGGIIKSDIVSLLADAKVHGVAVSSAIHATDDINKCAHDFIIEIDRATKALIL